jgi:excisionase family DNA binding protein
MKIYTLEEIAEILNVTTRVVRDYVKSGKLKRIENVGVIRVTEENLKAFIEGK